jgi:hypothetical protein
MIWGWFFLIPLAALCFAQNAAYTWSSKTRAAGNPRAHRIAGWFSNGAYYIGNIVLTIYTVKYLQGSPVLLVASCIVYMVATSEGSVHVMKHMDRRQRGACGTST